MDTLRLYYPAKPYIVTQAWGVLNGSYEQFGFSKHNGEDFRIGSDNRTHCPLRAEVIETGYDDAKGNYVRLISTEQYVVGGTLCWVGMVFMHHEKVLAKKGHILEIGGVMGVPDNTGFSTGPHTHGSYYRLGGMYKNERLDTDTATNNTFDPHPYWTGFYAQDYDLAIKLYQQLVGVLGNVVRELSKKRSAPPASSTQIS